MVSKREARERSKALKMKRFNASKSALIDLVESAKEPRKLSEPTSDRTPRISESIQLDSSPRVPKIALSSCYESLVTWCVSKHDAEGLWSGNEPRAWTDPEWTNIINPAFVQFVNLTWKEIDGFSSGTKHKMHHSHGFVI